MRQRLLHRALWGYNLNAMTIRFELPESVEILLKAGGGDPSRVMLESALVELYRQDQITHHELGKALALSRFEVDAILKCHGVTEDLPTWDEVAKDAEQLRQLLAQ